jgi:hypothetical protein
MSALSQVDYLQNKLNAVEDQIKLVETDPLQQELIDISELYFQKGKLYSEIELLKRVPAYE